MKLFLSDLDGTLLDASRNIRTEDLAAIRRLHTYGIGFGIVTGRDIGFCRHLIQRYQLPCNVIIGNNGSSVWLDGVKIMEKSIHALDTLRIMDFLKDHLMELNPFVCNEQRVFYLMREHYPKEKWEEVKHTLSYLGELAQVDMVDYLKQEQEPIVKISIHTYTQECRDKWLPILREQFGQSYEILPTSLDYIEITRKGIDKAKALKTTMQKLHIGAEEVGVIGDETNDVTLFHEVPMSFSMASARKEVQNEAAYVVKNVAEAIAFVIKYTTSNK